MSQGDAGAGEATLYRDQWGVPHVWADSYEAAGYALGQAQSQDSLYQTIYCLHAGVGRLSELLGPSVLALDIEARKIRHREFAEAAWPHLSRPVRELVSGFCAGINDYLKSHPDEFRPRNSEVSVPVAPIEPAQVLAWHRARLLRGSIKMSQLDAEASQIDGYKAFVPPPDANAPASKNPDDGACDVHSGIPPGESNSWAISGAKTASGKPMLLIDPHGPGKGEYQFYELWLHVKDDLHAGGFAIAGTPLPGLGVTPYVAWTFTAGGADSADAYALEINPENPQQYRFDGRWEDMHVRRETIRVRQADGSFTEQSLDALATRHGPVLETKGGVPFAASFGGYDRADMLDEFYRMATARTTAELKAAFALDRLSYLNLMWATAEGDIGYAQLGQAPLRPPGVYWKKLIPGWTSASLAQEKIPFARLPAVENPVCGFLQNCNVAANVVASGVAFTRQDFEAGVLDGHYGQYRARGQRATQLLTEVQQATLEDGRRIAFDTYIPPADLWVPVILQAYNEWQAKATEKESTADDRRLTEGARLLGTWNRYATKESTGATVFRFWRLACDRIESQVGRDDFRVPNTPEMRRESLQALRQAVDMLHEKYGRVAVPWGEIKRLRRGNQEWALSGDGLGKLGMDALRATAGENFSEQQKIVSGGGQVATAVVLLTNPPTIGAVATYGQSNNPGSKHFADQAPLYSEERFRTVPWTLEQLLPDIESQTTYRYPR